MKTMNDKTMRDLAIKLAKCDRSKEIKSLLKKHGFWDDMNCWHDVGNLSSNWSVIGNQQSDGLGALVEKIINQGDSVLASECHQKGIDPEDFYNAPKSVKEAKEKLLGLPQGDHSKLKPKDRTQLAKKYGGLVVTGDWVNPTYTIFDHGGGQAPEMFRETFVGLLGSNKSKVAFQQGKYGAGGTGSISFCDNGIQLIISRRNPKINDGSLSDDYGFTVTRKFEPTGNEKNPTVRYLVIDNEIPSFSADKPLKLLPKENNKFPCVEDWHHGAFIKLYDYDIGAGLRARGSTDLERKLSVRLLDPIFPVRIYERRATNKKSPESTMNGLRTRLTADNANILEPQSPYGLTLSIEGQQIDVEIYVLKDIYQLPNGKEKKVDHQKWHGKEGIIFEMNGQLNGSLDNSFYKKANLTYLDKSIITIVNCSKVGPEYASKIFMADRERMKEDNFFIELKKQLHDSLSKHDGLKSLMEKRRREFLTNTTEKINEDVLQRVLKSSPSLYKVLVNGNRLSSLVNTAKNGGGSFKPASNPTYFILQKPKKHSQNNPRAIEDGRMARIGFLTDAPNDYLTRAVNKGSYRASLNGVLMKNTPTFSPNDGTWTLNLKLPKGSKVGQKFELEVEVTDPTQSKPFIIKLWVEKISKIQRSSQAGTSRKKNGNGKGSNFSNNILDIPKAIFVTKKDKKQWEELGFDDRDAGMIRRTQDGTKAKYDIFISLDNMYFQHHKKEAAKKDWRIVEEQYKSGIYMNLLSLSNEDRNGNIEDIESRSKEFSRAISKVIVPVIKGLGGIQVN